MHIPVFIVDTFTSDRFKGSPTGICLLADRLPTKYMLAITRELNFPVTAFVRQQRGNPFSIRYFTTTTEIEACGHATLGAAAVVRKQTGRNDLSFLTAMEEEIPVSYNGNAVCFEYNWQSMVAYTPGKALLQSLQINSYKQASFCEALQTAFIELEDPEQLKTLQPDFVRMLASDERLKEVVITCAAEQTPYDFLLRSFCPWIGIDEDPVTGSVHAALAPYWAKRFGKSELRAYQASKRRGEFHLFVNKRNVRIEGHCVFVLEGQLQLS